jgi:uncharacterized membrane protein YdjX (TVP38/TMEM64 family)
MSHTGIIHLKKTFRTFQQSIRWYNGLATSNSKIKRGFSLIVLGSIAFLSILGVFQIVNPQVLKDWIHLKITLTDMGFTGVLTYLLMVAVLPLFSPIALVVVAGSAAFGPFTCFVLSYIGCIINANLTYFLVKALSVEKVWESNRRSIRVKNTIRRYGFLIVMSLQLICLIPFTLVIALAACSGISWKTFMKATCIGVCPGILLYSFMGDELVANMVSPRVYFAGTFAMAILLFVITLRKKKSRRAAARTLQKR